MYKVVPYYYLIFFTPLADLDSVWAAIASTSWGVVFFVLHKILLHITLLLLKMVVIVMFPEGNLSYIVLQNLVDYVDYLIKVLQNSTHRLCTGPFGLFIMLNPIDIQWAFTFFFFYKTYIFVSFQVSYRRVVNVVEKRSPASRPGLEYGQDFSDDQWHGGARNHQGAREYHNDCTYQPEDCHYYDDNSNYDNFQRNVRKSL